VRRLTLVAAGVSAALAGVTLGVGHVVGDRRMAMIRRALASQRRAGVFSEETVRNLPPAGRRYLLHSIAVGTPLAGVVQLETIFSMNLKPKAKQATELIARETLAPPRGFVWRARAGRGPVRLRVRDHYAERHGAVKVSVLGVPLVNAGGPDVTRSARHRLAIESAGHGGRVTRRKR
jgi:hypothetical protein